MSRKALIALCTAAILEAGGAFAPAAAGAAKAPSPPVVVRLHIVANSNSPQDLAAKIAVRDALWNYLQSRLATSQSGDQEAQALGSMTPSLARIARTTLQGYGLHYGASVRFGTADLPARTYLGERLPAGRYATLLVVLGKGAGQNWWCLLFPQLCFADQGASVGYGEGHAVSPSGFQALTKSLLPPQAPVVRPGGLLYSFWRRFHLQGH